MSKSRYPHAIGSASLAMLRSVAPLLSAAEQREMRERLRGMGAYETVFSVLAEVARPELARHALYALAAWAEGRASADDLRAIVAALAYFDPRASFFACVAIVERAFELSERTIFANWQSILLVARKRALYAASRRDAINARRRARRMWREGNVPYALGRVLVTMANWACEHWYTGTTAEWHALQAMRECFAAEGKRTLELAESARDSILCWAATPQSIELLEGTSSGDSDKPWPSRNAVVPEEPNL